MDEHYLDRDIALHNDYLLSNSNTTVARHSPVLLPCLLRAIALIVRVT